MELSTLSRNFYPGYQHLMVFNQHDGFEESRGVGSRYKLLLVLEGSGVVQLDQHAYPIIAPAIYCLNENESIKLVSGSQVKAASLYFHPSVVNHKFNLEQSLNQTEDLTQTDDQDIWALKPFIERDENYYGCIPLDPAFSRHALMVLEEIRDVLLSQSDSNWPCRSRSYLLELLFLAARIYQKPENNVQRVPSSAQDAIDPIIQYLHIHYRQKIKLNDLSKDFHTNRTTLNLKFRTHTGSSVISYLNSIRMQMASSMLRNTLLPKQEIMEKIGIKDDAHFIRNFRKYTGHSPSEYRNQFCWMLNK